MDLGSKIVLDTERCILCSRCVRFTDEVSKTHELGIFNRGDKSEIGVFKNKPLENDYAVNTVDICPVGALTSKDFRFQQRVWYLKTADSICTGCSAGCNTKIDYNEEGLFRVRPRYNENINKHWMCDHGRGLYDLVNKKGRLLKAIAPDEQLNSNGQESSTADVLKKLKSKLLDNNTKPKALVLTAQYTLEEYEDIVNFFLNLPGGGINNIYYWKNNHKSFDDFDGILLRGDKNPNTKGLLKVLNKNNVQTQWTDFETRLHNKEWETVFITGPENQKAYPDLKQKSDSFAVNCPNVVWWTAHPLPSQNEAGAANQKLWQIPSKTFFEKNGTYINFQGVSQKTKAVLNLVPSALSLSESTALLKGEELKKEEPPYLRTMKTNYFNSQKGSF